MVASLELFVMVPRLRVQGECAFCGTVGRWLLCTDCESNPDEGQQDCVCDDCLSDYDEGLI